MHNKNTTRPRLYRTAILAFATLLASSTTLAAEQLPAMSGNSNHIRWQSSPAWEIGAKALDMVHSLDGKKIFFLTEEQKVQIFSSNGKALGAVPVPAGVTHIDISPIGDKLYLLNNDTKKFTEVALAFQQPVDTTNSPMLGAANAPVSIVVFTDFQCPYCKKLPPVLEKVQQDNPDTVKIFFKNMPLISIHKMAEGAARAAIAAGNQGKFWPYHDKLFAANQLTPKKLEEFAEELGLDVEKFNTDMHSPETTRALQKDMYDAQKAGVEGTPSIFVNGWPLEDRSLEGFQAIIDTLLKTKE